MTPDARPSVSVSVALCTRNGAAYVAEQVESILRQRVPVDEVVVSDDDSTDGTVAIIEHAFAVAEAPPRLVVLRQRPALGVTANFQTAIASTTGDVVFLSDQDDVWEPTKVAVLLDALADASVDLVASDAALIDGDGAPLGETLLGRLGVSRGELERVTGAEGWRALLRRNLVTGATVAFRRSLLDVAVPFPSAWLHDEWLAIVAASVGAVRVVDEPLTRYRIHDANVVGMRRRTPGVMWARLVANGSERNASLRDRAEQLVERLDDLGGAVPSALRHDALAKLVHERHRSALPRSRWRRVAPVVRTAVRGGYARFGSGAQDILRDLVQPLDRSASGPSPSATLYPAGDVTPESDG